MVGKRLRHVVGICNIRMKFLYIFAVCLAVALAAPAPDQDEEQDQTRRRLRGLRLKIAETDPHKNNGKNDRSRYRDDDYNYLRKVAQGYLKKASSPYQVRESNQQAYYDLGSLQFRYQPPSQSSSANSLYDDSYLLTPNLNYYRASYLRDDRYRNDNDDDDDDDDRRD